MPITFLRSPEESTSSVRHHQAAVRAIITPLSILTQQLSGSDIPSELGKGDLVVREDKLYFFSSQTSVGFSIDYPSIIIHAVSRTFEGGQCIYCQLDVNEGEEGEEQPVELRFVPDDLGSLDAIYMALCDCAALHPSKESEHTNGGFYDDDDYENYDDEDNEFFTVAPSDEAELSEVGRAALAHLDSIISGPIPEQSQETGDQNDIDMENTDYDQFRDADENQDRQTR
ncbi:uncharacterized protein VTP21DRAFT_5742 [Calcarisporiella thermophila]|uniref:uncharacterized protein n=1 Tax=Calcarisporiella thermophila TaxID=911321 RepID=UPI0037440FFA